MTAPAWLNAVVGDFGRAAGAPGLALNARGSTALRFETGVSFRMEYTGAELVLAMAFPFHADLKRVLSISHPKARYAFRIRSGILPRTREGVLAIRLAEREVTLPQLNAAFAVLWRLAGEIGGAQWA